MKYRRKFKDEHILHFDGDGFWFGDRHFLIYGTTGFNVAEQKIQIRDDILIQEKGVKTPLSFTALMTMWDQFHPFLLVIAKKKMLVHKRSS